MIPEKNVIDAPKDKSLTVKPFSSGVRVNVKNLCLGVPKTSLFQNPDLYFMFHWTSANNTDFKMTTGSGIKFYKKDGKNEKLYDAVFLQLKHQTKSPKFLLSVLIKEGEEYDHIPLDITYKQLYTVNVDITADEKLLRAWLDLPRNSLHSLFYGRKELGALHGTEEHVAFKRKALVALASSLDKQITEEEINLEMGYVPVGKTQATIPSKLRSEIPKPIKSKERSYDSQSNPPLKTAKNETKNSPSSPAKKESNSMNTESPVGPVDVYIQDVHFSNYEEAIRFANKTISELELSLALKSAKAEDLQKKYEEFRADLARNNIWK
jgi:hypothetical protein